MKQVTLYMPEEKYPAFIDLVKNINFIKRVEEYEEPTKAEVLAGIRQSVKEINQIKSGKLKGIKAKDLLNEL